MIFFLHEVIGLFNERRKTKVRKTTALMEQCQDIFTCSVNPLSVNLPRHTWRLCGFACLPQARRDDKSDFRDFSRLACEKLFC
jgi:hypothetical protein